ncbi:conserved oligomeric golgi complex subunit 6 [Fagus crenata]
MGMAVATGLSRKLKKVLECRTESPNLVSSLKTLSTLYTENTPQSRRNLRYNIETCGLQINLDFLHASDAAQKALDLVEEQVNALSDCYDKIAKALESCSGSTGDIISTTKRLKQELEITSLSAMDNAHAFLFIQLLMCKR